MRVNGTGGLPPVPFGMLDAPIDETAMGALTVDPLPGSGHGWDDLVRIREETDGPRGCKVEIVEGIVTFSTRGAPAARPPLRTGNPPMAPSGSWTRWSTARS